jgi:hypothetical protein
MKLFCSNRYGVMAANSVSCGSFLSSEIKTFEKSELIMCLGLALMMCHQMILGNHNTSNRYGVMAANIV